MAFKYLFFLKNILKILEIIFKENEGGRFHLTERDFPVEKDCPI